jgi:hypothetical protein
MNQMKAKYSEDLDDFVNYSILEGQSFQSKLNTKIDELTRNGSDENERQFLLNFKNELRPALLVLDSYDFLIQKLISFSEKNNPLFKEVFFKKGIKIDRDLYLNLYPQYMSISHYAEIFNLCGYARDMDMEKINQITIKRMYAYQKFQLINKEVAISQEDEYSLGELYSFVKGSKITGMLSSFWQSGRQTTLEYMVSEKGGRLLSDDGRLKVFEVKSNKKTPNGFDVYYLIYLTPSFYSYQEDSVFNNQKGDYHFLNVSPKKKTCLVGTEELFFRHDFVKPITNTEDMRFSLKVSIPVNMFRFEVVKR